MFHFSLFMGQQCTKLDGEPFRHPPETILSDRQPLKFHKRHGENIALSATRDTAIRSEMNYSDGLVFSNRPVANGEWFCVQVKQVTKKWKGDLSLGFTSHDPSTLDRPLPKTACPELSGQAGFWAKPLPVTINQEDTCIHFYVEYNGKIKWWLNDKDKGVFLRGVDTREPLWAMVDLYGNCTRIQISETCKLVD